MWICGTQQTLFVKSIRELNEVMGFRGSFEAIFFRRSLNQPMGKIVLPYKPNCHFWWQCTASQVSFKHRRFVAAWSAELPVD
jgi:hypothetical protein